jgi:hypothetical protein
MAELVFSVVIPVYEFHDHLDLQLATLEQQSRRDDIECILVDDGSTAGIQSSLTHKRWGIDLRILRNHARMGRSISRNRGWRAARGHYVIFLEPDMIPEPGWLDAYRRAVEGNPDLILGTTLRLRPDGAGPRPAHPGSDRKGVPGDIPGVQHGFAASNVAITREFLSTCGGFSALLRKGDDLDIGFRLADLSPSVAVAEYATVRRLEGSTAHEGRWTEMERQAFLWRNPVRPALAAVRPDRAPGTFACSIDSVAAHLAELTGAKPSTIYRYLQEAVSHGLVFTENRGLPRFDIFHTLNWVRARTRFLEDELKNSSFARTHPTPRRREAGSQPFTMHCRGRYTIELDSVPGLSWRSVNLNIGLPVGHRCQRNVRLTRLTPSGLAAYVGHNSGVATNVPGELCLRNARIIGYEFECDVAEDCTPGSDTAPACIIDETDVPRPRDLRFAYPAAYLERTASLLEHILGGSRAAPEDDVRRIYRWVIENLSYAPTQLPDYSILDAGIGSCVHLTRLFINLVRLRGVPARERCGALMSRSTSPTEVVTVTLGHSLFSHTWAEVFLDGRGWFPIDFVVICYGKWRANRLNVSPALRADLVAESQELLDYYFGNVDPYRIYANTSMNRIPPVVAEGLSNQRGCGELMIHVHHRLVCSLSRYVAGPSWRGEVVGASGAVERETR